MCLYDRSSRSKWELLLHTERIIQPSHLKLSIRPDIKGNVLKGLLKIFASAALHVRVNMQFRAQRAICQAVCCGFSAGKKGEGGRAQMQIVVPPPHPALFSPSSSLEKVIRSQHKSQGFKCKSFSLSGTFVIVSPRSIL